MSSLDPTDAERPADDRELRHLYDDVEDPSEVTIFAPGTERFPTEWITAGRSAAVSLTDAR